MSNNEQRRTTTSNAQKGTGNTLIFLRYLDVECFKLGGPLGRIWTQQLSQFVPNLERVLCRLHSRGQCSHRCLSGDTGGRPAIGQTNGRSGRRAVLPKMPTTMQSRINRQPTQLDRFSSSFFSCAVQDFPSDWKHLPSDRNVQYVWRR